MNNIQMLIHTHSRAFNIQSIFYFNYIQFYALSISFPLVFFQTNVSIHTMHKFNLQDTMHISHLQVAMHKLLKKGYNSYTILIQF